MRMWKIRVAEMHRCVCVCMHMKKTRVAEMSRCVCVCGCMYVRTYVLICPGLVRHIHTCIYTYVLLV
jgi:hypothetical protein